MSNIMEFRIETAENQRKRIMRHLETHHTLTQREALALYGVQRLAARICELRNEGKVIFAERVTCENQFGEKTHYAKYFYLAN